jgi:hypothetical protein
MVSIITPKWPIPIVAASSRRNEPPPVQVMRHPHPQPIDAATIPPVALAEYVRDSGRNSKIQKALDFVNVTDTKLETLFLRGKDRLISRSTLDGKLIHPPAVLRRSAKVIRDFYDLKVEDKFDLMEKYKNYINCRTR